MISQKHYVMRACSVGYSCSLERNDLLGFELQKEVKE